MTSTESTRDVRIARLRRARQADSETKATRTQGAIQDLLNAGQRVSFARVAREADVSTWFVYNTPAINTAIRTAMSDQAQYGREAAAMPRLERATPASLHTDLALAREEIQELKRERDALKRRVQLTLGAEIDSLAHTNLVRRIQDLERQNQALSRDFAEAHARAGRLTEQQEEADETIASLRLALRKAMRAVT
ncbi:hypothetical protein AQJ11_33415 [Streptomyces corchorusii]|uniref:Transposase n=2 Tax=Streptomyces TaxID=1883 RepID=A0A124HK71_STRCK|nr:DUF6262 family protein [Streptomyces corchorusii]KUN18689.1 hypothetical protein AQJ11_33415 [Streptomyces corchorusii]